MKWSNNSKTQSDEKIRKDYQILGKIKSFHCETSIVSWLNQAILLHFIFSYMEVNILHIL